MVQKVANSDVLVFADRPRDWTQQELAEFYRVENALTQSGLRVSSDRGLSDEGDPWFIFFRDNDHEPLVHFARVDGYYIIASGAYDGIAKGKNFREMILDLLSRHRLDMEVAKKKSNVLFHPAALLITLVGVAFFKAPSSAQADELNQTDLVSHKNKELISNKEKSITTPSSTLNIQGHISPAPSSGSYEEIASLLLPLVVDLSLTPSTAFAQDLSDTSLPKDLSSQEKNDPALTPESKTSLSLHVTAPLANAADYALLTQVDQIASASPVGDTSVVPTADAQSLLELLNAVPVSKAANNLDAAIALAKQSISQKNFLQETALSPYFGSANKFSLDLTTPTKTFFADEAAAIQSEKEQKKLLVSTTDNSTNLTHAAKTTDTVHSTGVIEKYIQLPLIDNKISLIADYASALGVINNLNQSFNFIDWNQNTPIKTGELITGTIQNAPMQSVLTSNDAPSIYPVNSYSISVVDGLSQSNAATPQTNQGAISLSGEAVGGLLIKFFQTFMNVSFEIKSDEVIFKTSSAYATDAPVEQINIHFLDGSNINIIGQKSEIDTFMLTA